MALVPDPDNIRLAMLGMVEGNGHPFSWSAIINGRYDAQAMADCGYPVIPQYLGEQPPENLGIAGAEVTHVWCDDRADAEHVARASFVPNVLDRAEDAIGQVDAAIIATDIGHEHLERARPFIEADVPLFIDKPLTDRYDHLKQFIQWQKQGKAFCSTSAMRYSPQFQELRGRMKKVGIPRLVIMTMFKSWERYGIHALEGLYPLLAPYKWRSVTNTGTKEANIVHARHADGVEVLLPTIADMKGGYGHLQVFGTKGHLCAESSDTFTAFKSQLVAFIDYLRTGEPPVEFDQTIELMKIIIAGTKSREAGGEAITLQELGEHAR